jgi:hypothetical protein
VTSISTSSLGRSIRKRDTMQDARRSRLRENSSHWMSPNPEVGDEVWDEVALPSTTWSPEWPGTRKERGVMSSDDWLLSTSPFETPLHLLESRSAICHKRLSGSPLCGKDQAGDAPSRE